MLNSEEFFREPHNTLRRVFEFVQVDTDFVAKDLVSRNVASNRRDIESGIYEYLKDYFAPHNQQLYELIGKDYEW